MCRAEGVLLPSSLYHLSFNAEMDPVRNTSKNRYFGFSAVSVFACAYQWAGSGWEVFVQLV